MQTSMIRARQNVPRETYAKAVRADGQNQNKGANKMKLFIASDIHGSLYYCSKMLEAYEREQAERLLLLGDILYHGPRNELPREYAPKGVIELLNSKKNEIYCVRGNCEAEVDQAVLQFPVLAEYMLLPLEGGCIFAAHGHNYNESSLPPLRRGDILLNGHTHIPCCKQHDAYVYMNPGSIALPKGGSYNGYMLMEGGSFIWKDIAGNVRQRFELR